MTDEEARIYWIIKAWFIALWIFAALGIIGGIAFLALSAMGKLPVIP